MTDLTHRSVMIMFAAMFVAAVIVAVLGGFIAWRSYVNDGRCAAALGDGSIWAGQHDCYAPPVHVDGLM